MRPKADLVTLTLADRGAPELGRARRKASSCGGARRRRAIPSGRPSNVAPDAAHLSTNTCQAIPTRADWTGSLTRDGIDGGAPIRNPWGRPHRSLPTL